MRMYDVIRKKRDGGELSENEIGFFVRGYTRGEIPDYQASALLMAAYLKGLSFAETDALTREIIRSGTTLDLSGIEGIKADKHSTGGVGDGVSLAVAAGNAYSAAYGNAFGAKALATNPDYGVVGDPSTWGESMSVASVNNSMMKGPYITAGGENYAYYDSATIEGASSDAIAEHAKLKQRLAAAEEEWFTLTEELEAEMARQQERA